MIIAILNEEKMPESCWDCPMLDRTASDYGVCPVTGYGCYDDDEHSRPCECPLKEVPDDVLQS